MPTKLTQSRLNFTRTLGLGASISEATSPVKLQDRLSKLCGGLQRSIPIESLKLKDLCTVVLWLSIFLKAWRRSYFHKSCVGCLQLNSRINLGLIHGIRIGAR